ncbi:phage tail domain-containing protein [Hominifimenecus sp. rT4P-3]|uniref:phage tail domain-containing protein n=1 Tax=Hominifimenecus sp. rT4P-3 TaxID=3242979 RepID=UPI003DA22B3D
MTTAKSFVFGGQSLKNLGLRLCSFDGGGEVKISLPYVPTYTAEKPPAHYRWQMAGSKYEAPITFTISFGKPCGPDHFFSLEEERRLAKWLTFCPDFQEFHFEDFDSDWDDFFHISYFVHVTSLEKEMLGGNCIGFTAEFTADAPFGFSAPITRTLSTGTTDFDVCSDSPDPIYPRIILTAGAAGNVSLKNCTNGSFSRFYNLSAGEILTMEKTGSGLLTSLPSHSILDDFDKNWISLADGVNEWKIEGNASLTLTYREPRKVGI